MCVLVVCAVCIGSPLGGWGHKLLVKKLMPKLSVPSVSKQFGNGKKKLMPKLPVPSVSKQFGNGGKKLMPTLSVPSVSKQFGNGGKKLMPKLSVPSVLKQFGTTNYQWTKVRVNNLWLVLRLLWFLLRCLWGRTPNTCTCPKPDVPTRPM